MSVVNGLPAHILLVHLIVVLVPLTALLAVLSAVWPAARRRFAWLVLALAALVAVMTPVTTEAGEWLERRVSRTADLHNHTRLGDTFIFFAIPLLIAAAALAFVHFRETRDRTPSRVVVAAVAVLTIATSAAATVQVYRIGESGAQSSWNGVAARAPLPRGE
ncbi:DUF2231 domain-containing protein [Nocardia seriolae]|uniref:DUF2231 domain-containing protein n=1 Tax=Nocardia seriolae TaxID=37332 RepID=A0A0B8N3B8_9NOCA|nr:DUF2231 domain-containing protein [Nocardia seriolae]APA97323.1 hypothetical protein NS506_03270 [Nocardia seriolae]MTJ62232.1 hypothetical protein [Nocardia seriolae]MTJ74201.1 hypothetical protein [Nocardia seriolae]MTJ87141.1 hypothetical protein [Nocardia seriolae]MTK31135.1 hypothetical protein [Nocardia seriolae]